MHYDGTLRGFFSNPIMKDKLTGKSIEVNKELSPMDIEKLNKLYPCKSTTPACGKFLCDLKSNFNFFQLRLSLKSGNAR